MKVLIFIHILITYVLKFSIPVILFPTVVLAEEETMQPVNGKSRDWCFAMRDRYHIIPGQSFGNLPKNYHTQYLASKCDQFFCKPHKGIGKFNCEPIGQ